ncbi:MAG TPA: pilus assembly protein TadG-related protein [Roseiarcus sp.]|nr:pilus assembly protein TadG-related protein [Roseiarcus sp.]
MTAPRTLALFGEDRGAVAVMFAAASPIILGAAGLAVEASYWQLHQRAMQNAADSAAIAAGMEGGTNYAAVAKAVAAQ